MPSVLAALVADFVSYNALNTLRDHPHVGDVRGRGLMLALEFVENKESKTPFAPDKMIAQNLQAIAMTHGLMCYPNQGTADGKAGDHVILAPPYIITEAQIDELIEKFEKSTNELFGR